MLISIETHITCDFPGGGQDPLSLIWIRPGDITVDLKGFTKLLDGLDVHKASGLDGLSARVLKECSDEISPILELIFNVRENSGSIVECLTRDRRTAGSSLTGVTTLWFLSKTHLS